MFKFSKFKKVGNFFNHKFSFIILFPLGIIMLQSTCFATGMGEIIFPSNIKFSQVITSQISTKYYEGFFMVNEFRSNNIINFFLPIIFKSDQSFKQGHSKFFTRMEEFLPIYKIKSVFIGSNDGLSGRYSTDNTSTLQYTQETASNGNKRIGRVLTQAEEK